MPFSFSGAAKPKPAGDDNAAPFLHEYFSKVTERVNSQDFMALGMEALSGGGKDKIKQLEKETADWYESEGKELLKKVF